MLKCLQENCSKKYKRIFHAAWKIRLYFIFKYHASTNLIERYHRTLKTAIAIYSKQDFRRWDDPVPYLLFSLRNSKNNSLGLSPAQLVFGKTLQHPFLNDDKFSNGTDTFFDLNTYKDSIDVARLEMLQKSQANLQEASSKEECKFLQQKEEKVLSLSLLSPFLNKLMPALNFSRLQSHLRLRLLARFSFRYIVFTKMKSCTEGRLNSCTSYEVQQFKKGSFSLNYISTICELFN